MEEAAIRTTSFAGRFQVCFCTKKSGTAHLIALNSHNNKGRKKYVEKREKESFACLGTRGGDCGQVGASVGRKEGGYGVFTQRALVGGGVGYEAKLLLLMYW